MLWMRRDSEDFKEIRLRMWRSQQLDYRVIPPPRPRASIKHEAS